MSFTTAIQGSGNKTGIQIAEQVTTARHAGKRPVTLKGKNYCSSIAVMGGQNLIPLSAADHELTGVRAGDTVVVDPSGSCGRDGGGASSSGVLRESKLQRPAAIRGAAR